MALVFELGYVSAVTDEYHAERIKAVIPRIDWHMSLDKVPYAFPLLPKMLHIKPKIGEAVAVFIDSDNMLNGQRYYLGPIISQPQKMDYDSFASLSATKMLNGGLLKPDNSIDNIPLSAKVFPEDDEIAIIGRKNSEIILSDDDIRLRCGVRVTDPSTSKVTLNGKNTNNSENKLSDSTVRTAPAFIKLKYYESPLKTTAGNIEQNPHTTTLSTATIVADKINLISPNGTGGFFFPGNEEAITDEQMKKIIETAHQLPYGDTLCEFLSLLLKMFFSHYHPYDGAPVDEAAPDCASFLEKYGIQAPQLAEKLLSKDIRIN